MKKLFPLLVASIAFLTATAQDSTTIRNKIITVINDAKNEFVKNTGAMEEDPDKKFTFYKSKTNLGAKYNQIVVVKADNSKYFIADFNYIVRPEERKQGNICKAAALSVAKEFTATKKYTLETYNDNDWNYQEDSKITLLKDSNKNRIMKLEEGESFFRITIYSKLWGTK